MGKATPFQPGSIIWARLRDRDGQNEKVRPLLVVPPAPNGPDAVLCCLAISTDPKNDPTDPAVPIPWDAGTGSSTGLFQPCRVFLLRHVQVSQTAVVDHSGRTTKSNLADILAARDIAMSYPNKPRS